MYFYNNKNFNKINKKIKKKIKLQFFKRHFFHTDFYYIINNYIKLHYCPFQI